MLKEGYEPTRSPNNLTYLCKKCSDVRDKEEEEMEQNALKDLSLGKEGSILDDDHLRILHTL